MNQVSYLNHQIFSPAYPVKNMTIVNVHVPKGLTQRVCDAGRGVWNSIDAMVSKVFSWTSFQFYRILDSIYSVYFRLYFLVFELKEPGPNHGFARRTNRCYLNSTLQALLVSPDFKKWVKTPFPSLKSLLKAKHSEVVEALKKASKKEKAILRKNYNHAVQDIKSSYKTKLGLHKHLKALVDVVESGGNPYDVVGNIRDYLFNKKVRDEFEGDSSQQVDAAAVLEAICETYGRIFFQKDVRKGQLNGEHFQDFNMDPIHFLRIHLSEKKRDSFQQLVDLAYSDIEGKDEGYFEYEDGKKTEYMPYLRHYYLQLVDNLPPDFIPIQLLRFTGTKKDYRSVSFEKNFRIDLSCAFDQKELAGQSAIYELISVVRHSGIVEEGHYYAFVKDEGIWYKCDDDVVTKISSDDVEAEDGYLYFFKRVV